MTDEAGGAPPDLRAQALEEMGRLLEAAEVLRQDLGGHVEACRAIIDGIGRSDPLVGVMESAGSPSWRPRLTDSLLNYERLRHRARLRLIALGRSEGMAVEDVERLWAITRQLANRSIREAESLD